MMATQIVQKDTQSNGAYESPSTKGYFHSIQSYFAEILLIKKFPNLIKIKWCWKDTEHSADYCYFVSLSHELTKKYPIHLLTEIVVHSNITDFNSDGIIKYINSKISDWSEKQNKTLKRWCDAAIVVGNNKPKVVTAKKTYGKIKW